MKKTATLILILGACWLFSSCGGSKSSGCLTGAFLADKPIAADIERFSSDYGKRPALVLIFLGWKEFPDKTVVRDIYESGSALVVTWEPWFPGDKEAVDLVALLAGKDDTYIREFALRLKAVKAPVFLRLAHEMNGDWYPWSGKRIGKEVYVSMFRHIHNIFSEIGVHNVRWVFSINAENVPSENAYEGCYPGDRYVDYIGLDGYNWGTAQAWSRWRSFKDIFAGIYGDVVRRYKKPVIISEFGSSSSGGDKARWIEEALQEIKKMPEVMGFILFNVDKETDWHFSPDAADGRRLGRGLKDAYFLQAREGSLQ